MAQRFDKLSDKFIDFINRQPMFFVATATSDSRINLSPKGLDTLQVCSENQILWLNLTGSGNETAIHIQEDGRMTLMFCAFNGNPLILRVYGKACVIHQGDDDWQALAARFADYPGSRQIFDLTIDLVQTSCGWGVPLLEYQEDRKQLEQWAAKKEASGIQQYWNDRNQLSLDGKETHIMKMSGIADPQDSDS